ncbi:hypothetical protein NHP190012_16900 (plasmid) [Helicobacter sp. NHP19-012]|uniref:Uncharacterized protein n=1 Tax=Helicobacter gastrofelis TaxID=2849642 RepID=A0ABM7SPQ5_9HELI|nr:MULTISPECIES: hypothetical protein [unclassified Helicobacter]BCZ20048.1 hypothetical protein NHP190012_16900 [Helicobacter sp. NHP19-012]GMB96944.1 hypothetical protein NHP22001_15340 [Helicobacter sp. NHP22-001]
MSLLKFLIKNLLASYLIIVGLPTNLYADKLDFCVRTWELTLFGMPIGTASVKIVSKTNSRLNIRKISFNGGKSCNNFQITRASHGGNLAYNEPLILQVGCSVLQLNSIEIYTTDGRVFQHAFRGIETGTEATADFIDGCDDD